MQFCTSTLIALAVLSASPACAILFDSPTGVEESIVSDGGADAAPAALTIVSNSPISGATSVFLDSAATATFSEPMDPETLNAASFTLTSGDPGVAVAGSVLYRDSVASFQPSELLALETLYTATITTATTSASGLQIIQDYSWTFTSSDGADATLPIDFKSAGDFVILAKTAISNVGPSAVAGDLGISPATAAAITGFALVLQPPNNDYSTSSQVTGRVYAFDYAAPTPVKVQTAIFHMQNAYTAAANRQADVLEAGGIDIGGRTFEPGVYQWDGAIDITADVTLSGSATDVWIFQVDGALTMHDFAQIVLVGGARAKNVFWQASGAVLIKPIAHAEGSILSATAITLISNASVNGRLFAQTAVTLGANVVVEPEP